MPHGPLARFINLPAFTGRAEETARRKVAAFAAHLAASVCARPLFFRSIILRAAVVGLPQRRNADLKGQSAEAVMSSTRPQDAAQATRDGAKAPDLNHKLEMGILTGYFFFTCR